MLIRAKVAQSHQESAEMPWWKHWIPPNPEGNISTFVDEGEPMGELLSHVLKQSRIIPFVDIRGQITHCHQAHPAQGEEGEWIGRGAL